MKVKKLLIPVFAAFLMAFAFMPVFNGNVNAATAYNIWIGGVQVTDENKSNVLGDEGKTVSYDPGSKTLTLNGATIQSGETPFIIDKVDLTIVLKGNTVVLPKTGSGVADHLIQINDSNITVKGTGSLETADYDNLSARGLYLKGGSITLTSGKVNLNGYFGELTYFTSDMAYHYDKVQRGFDRLIDIWGADHHGYIKRCEAMMEAWGHAGMLEVVLGQLVNLLRDGEPVRMSKRTGEMVTFEELVDEVGVDATRFLMLSRSSDQMIDFDIEVAKKQDASNPVYYVQYAHARICSILRKAECEIPADVDLTPLVHESELALMRKMDDFAEVVAAAARDRAPFRLTHYAQELAGVFHQFYTNCHIIGEEDALRDARLALADACRVVLALTLSLLGVSAPERM